ncbi:hypothetical protein V6Z11_D08G082600 [Gossypium hirsutum]
MLPSFPFCFGVDWCRCSFCLVLILRGDLQT